MRALHLESPCSIHRPSLLYLSGLLPPFFSFYSVPVRPTSIRLAAKEANVVGPRCYLILAALPCHLSRRGYVITRTVDDVHTEYWLHMCLICFFPNLPGVAPWGHALFYPTKRSLM